MKIQIINQNEKTEDSFEITKDNEVYTIIKGVDDEVYVKKKETSLKDADKLFLKSYLSYFGVKSFEELKRLNKNEIVETINRQVDEKSSHFFHPQPYEVVLWNVRVLVDNLLNAIDGAIKSVMAGESTFTRLIKDIITISCIFDKECKVWLELEDKEGLDMFHSLLATDQGHLPIPIFLSYLGYKENGFFDEEEIVDVKNVIYFIRGYGTTDIPVTTRKYDDGVKKIKSPLFQKAIALFNKQLIEEGNKDEFCPSGSMPDGMGHCREVNEELMKKSKEELTNDILKSLVEIREKIVLYKKQLQKEKR